MGSDMIETFLLCHTTFQCVSFYVWLDLWLAPRYRCGEGKALLVMGGTAPDFILFQILD